MNYQFILLIILGALINLTLLLIQLIDVVHYKQELKKDEEYNHLKVLGRTTLKPFIPPKDKNDK